MQDLNKLDLNLLRLLKALVDTGSTKAAALKLGISQASASRGLTQLKAAFGNQLFVRQAHGMQASELALSLARAIEQMLEPVSLALQQYHEFDASQYSAPISLLVDPYLLEEQGGRLVSQLHQRYPKAPLNLLHLTEQSYEGFTKGEFDYLICDNDTELAQSLFCEPLYQEPMQILARKGHPSLGANNCWSDLAELPVVHLPEPWLSSRHHYVEREYQKHKLQPNVVLETHSLTAGLELLANSDAILFASRSTCLLRSDIDTFALPSVSEDFSTVEVFGGFLQRRRNHPFYQHLHLSIAEILTGD
ncbi:LysR family transcriptional regulator [Paraferrimonas sedimenticola]|uniref:LysR family transcriptional regulator n=1 Tax=Paraferrimonas sedimenticola TaxID=375674 RepID=A0AA37VZZ1_9GAMM|nr:LysR family transcriptional regulator [Paraferrimonas sedimenticola]GLP97916.1 LysR family transcriptional regulator [Paraferrimonas sedimenticola]